MTTDQINQAIETMQAKLDTLVQVVTTLCAQQGSRLNRQQFADRLGVHRNTLRTMLKRDRQMPRPGEDGKWLLSEVIEWEKRKSHRRMV